MPRAHHQDRSERTEDRPHHARCRAADREEQARSTPLPSIMRIMASIIRITTRKITATTTPIPPKRRASRRRRIPRRAESTHVRARASADGTGRTGGCAWRHSVGVQRATASSRLRPAAPAKSRAGTFFFGAVTGCLLVVVGVLVLVILAATMAGDSSELSLSGDKVAVIPIEGEIVDAPRNARCAEEIPRQRERQGDRHPHQQPRRRDRAVAGDLLRIRHTRADSESRSSPRWTAWPPRAGTTSPRACDTIVANPGSITAPSA